MTQDNRDSLVYQNAMEFARQILDGKVTLKDAAQKINVNNIITGDKTTLAGLIAYLSGEFLRLTDVIVDDEKEYLKALQGNESADVTLQKTILYRAKYNQTQVADALLHAKLEAQAHNVLDEGST